MVVKNNKVIVIDKSKEAEYLKKGWGLAEQVDEVEEAVSPEQQAAIAISKKEKEEEEMKNEGVLGAVGGAMLGSPLNSGL